VPAPDFAAEGLLDGLADEAERDARLELLQQLHDAGVSIDELRRAVADQRLALVPVELVLGGKPRYTPREVAREAGVELEALQRSRHALGLPVSDPDACVLTEEDLEAARRGRRLAEAGVSEAQLVAFNRAVGEATSRVAAAVRALFGEGMVRPGDSELDLGTRFAEAARALRPDLGRALDYAATLHLREQLRRDVVTGAEREAGQILPGAQQVAVCFADMVGFTRLGTEVAADELGAVAERLASLAVEVAREPVHLVKTIGDAAMLVSPDASALLDAALDLVDAAEAEGEGFPRLKAGVAVGPALNRGGDWYGHTVNLASRITDIARRGSVVATREVHDELEDRYRWSFAGQRQVKGIREPVELFRARRLPDEDDQR
jgi:adenylate cyclase